MQNRNNFEAKFGEINEKTEYYTCWPRFRRDRPVELVPFPISY